MLTTAFCAIRISRCLRLSGRIWSRRSSRLRHWHRRCRRIRPGSSFNKYCITTFGVILSRWRKASRCQERRLIDWTGSFATSWMPTGDRETPRSGQWLVIWVTSEAACAMPWPQQTRQKALHLRVRRRDASIRKASFLRPICFTLFAIKIALCGITPSRKAMRSCRISLSWQIACCHPAWPTAAQLSGIFSHISLKPWREAQGQQGW